MKKNIFIAGFLILSHYAVAKLNDTCQLTINFLKYSFEYKGKDLVFTVNKKDYKLKKDEKVDSFYLYYYNKKRIFLRFINL